MASQQPLLINGDEEQNRKKQHSNRLKWMKCLFFPLDVLIFPLTCCMRHSCWSKRRHFQYDLALQLMGVFQTLIGALLATSLVSVIEYFEESEQMETVYIALYVIGASISHTLSIYTVVFW